MTKFGYRAPHEVHEWSAGIGFDRDGLRGRGPSLVENRPLYGPHLVPENQYQALMEADFGQEPVMSADEREADWLLFETKIQQAGLTEREMIVMESVVFGQMSLTKAADVLARHEGKNRPYSREHIRRIRNAAFDKLRAVFATNGEDE
jgi:hypothetical protein